MSGPTSHGTGSVSARAIEECGHHASGGHVVLHGPDHGEFGLADHHAGLDFALDVVRDPHHPAAQLLDAAYPLQKQVCQGLSFDHVFPAVSLRLDNRRGRPRPRPHHRNDTPEIAKTD